VARALAITTLSHLTGPKHADLSGSSSPATGCGGNVFWRLSTYFYYRSTLAFIYLSTLYYRSTLVSLSAYAFTLAFTPASTFPSTSIRTSTTALSSRPVCISNSCFDFPSYLHFIPLLPLYLRASLHFDSCFSSLSYLHLHLQNRKFKMNFSDLPAELLEPIIDFTIPNNWLFHNKEERWVLDLRRVCSKAFGSSSSWYFSQLMSLVSFRII
jgi:hypothetical protein